MWPPNWQGAYMQKCYCLFTGCVYTLSRKDRDVPDSCIYAIHCLLTGFGDGGVGHIWQRWELERERHVMIFGATLLSLKWNVSCLFILFHHWVTYWFQFFSVNICIYKMNTVPRNAVTRTGNLFLVWNHKVAVASSL
jgi:hypothetical protein